MIEGTVNGSLEVTISLILHSSSGGNIALRPSSIPVFQVICLSGSAPFS